MINVFCWRSRVSLEGLVRGSSELVCVSVWVGGKNGSGTRSVR